MPGRRRAQDALITVRASLRLPALARGAPEVVAGHSRLDGEIRWAHAGEVPDMPSLLKGGEMLLTTGMGIGARDPARRRFVDELAQSGAAALVIELGGTFARLPAALATAAERRELPLIVLHRQVRFVEITEAIHREIVNRQLVLMRRGDELHNRFTALMLRGAGIPEVLRSLAREIANPVVLERSGDGVLYHAAHHADDDAVMAAYAALDRGIPEAPATIVERVPMGDGGSWGRLIALGLDSPLEDLDQVAVERAVGLIALALLRGRQEETLAARERGDYLVALLEEDGGLDETTVRSRAVDFGFDGSTPIGLPIVVGRASRERGSPEESTALIWREIQGELRSRSLPAIVGTNPPAHDLLMVVGLQSLDARARVAGLVARLVRAATARQLRDAGAPPVVCVGAGGRSWAETRDGLLAASRAIPAASHAAPREWHDVAAPNVDRLLFALRDDPDLQAFTQARLGPLLAHPRRTALLETLEAYLSHGRSKSETARALHLERQSLYHRLRRIEAILGVDLADEQILFGLQLALQAPRKAQP